MNFMNDDKINRLAKILWEYLKLRQSLVKSDCIFIFGGHDPSVAIRGAELFLEGWAPIVVISGGVIHAPGMPISDGKALTEAEAMAQIVTNQGVPMDRIIIEDQAKNTGENFLLTDKLLTKLGYSFQSFILVQKPYAERRALLAGLKRWPKKQLIVTSPQVTYEEYLEFGIPKDKVINMMVGEVQRIKVYVEQGYQVPQAVPTYVWEAYSDLVELGFDKRLVAD